jgi:hypothetical protein
VLDFWNFRDEGHGKIGLQEQKIYKLPAGAGGIYPNVSKIAFSMC